MTEHNVVPIWALATQDVDVPAIVGSEGMTEERLTALRTAMASLADAPIATLEAHPMPDTFDRSRGIALASASPLAQHLSQLIGQTSKASPAVSGLVSGEVLYKMVVPAKVAAQVGSGVIRPMASTSVSGGVHSALVGSSRIAAQATFVPVAGKAAAAGAAGGSAATAGVAAAGATALTVAAPLVLMAVAVGVSAYAEQQRRNAIQRITELLEKVHQDKLDDERNQLDGCRRTIDKATAILLDKGQVGHSSGLSPAVQTIETAIATAERRLSRWQRTLLAFKGPVEWVELKKKFPGIEDVAGGEFHVHLELAALAIALKRRVIVLQAVEHAQLDSRNPFERFVDALKDDQRHLDALDSGIAALKRQLSALRLDRTHGLRDFMFSAGEVDELLRASAQLRALGDGVGTYDRRDDVAIEMVRSADGSLVVLPAVSA